MRHHSAESQGESTRVKKPSNSSTQGAPGGRGGTDPHSGYVQARSQAYHSQTVSPTYTRPSATKMTRTEHQLDNQEDNTSRFSDTKRLKQGISE